jgi:hypothetical protein
MPDLSITSARTSRPIVKKPSAYYSYIQGLSECDILDRIVMASQRYIQENLWGTVFDNTDILYFLENWSIYERGALDPYIHIVMDKLTVGQPLPTQ